MATLAPMGTSVRQPFGIVNDAQLRKLQSVKNRQNAITPSSASSLKRRAPSPENSDSENIDPHLFDNIKRSKLDLSNDASISKPARYSLNTIPTSKPRVQAPSTSTPRLITQSQAPLSAPAAAGRSPTKPKSRLLAQPKRRLAPPTFGIKPTSSISSLLSGTLANKKPRKQARTIQESKPKSWFFDIYEESGRVQNDRMNEWTLSQSASFLDVSDDEGNAKGKDGEDRGKENIDPNEVSVPVTRAMAAAKAAKEDEKKDEMVDDRTALGELDASKFYGEGLDASSVVLVKDDDEDAETVVEEPITEVEVADKADFTFEAQQLPESSQEVDTQNIGSIIMASVPNWEIPSEIESPLESKQQDDVDELTGDALGDIEIWESESAKDENEKLETGSVNGDGEVFALQEL